ncbi:prion-like-(Q/N-rich) domain-bearing protein 25 [Amphibalanus amphitrite]|uniref:prion-like-(Q/N-rich) domain-bearing protein 25 n=1 Tax=Amphibalanus amphitrite TaxID=1232801 RepID=UPI001C915223|nr:prion-like-(Q/N-rich) domain-bearing protein 25 [Amphibalanus amphitrite]
MGPQAKVLCWLLVIWLSVGELHGSDSEKTSSRGERLLRIFKNRLQYRPKLKVAKCQGSRCTIQLSPLVAVSASVPVCDYTHPCPSGHHCLSGHCFALPKSLCGTSQPCSPHRQCPCGELCHNGRCTKVKPAGIGSPCVTHSQCHSENCKNGYCANQCLYDTDCSTNQYCDGYRCQHRLPLYGTCSENRQCLSNACNGGSCVQCHSSYDCPLRHFCDHNTCHSLRKLRESCHSDQECLSGKCGRLNFCVLCRSHADCRGGTVCSSTGICRRESSAGSECSSSEDCLSGVCGIRGYCIECRTNGECEGQERCDKGVCRPLQLLGQQCDANADCESGICHSLSCVECTGERSCGTGRFCSSEGLCQTQAELGEACTLDQQCISGLCEELLNQCVRCTDDSHCEQDETCTGDHTCAPIQLPDTITPVRESPNVISPSENFTALPPGTVRFGNTFGSVNATSDTKFDGDAATAVATAVASVTVDNVTAMATADATAVVTLEDLIRQRIMQLRQAVAAKREALSEGGGTDESNVELLDSEEDLRPLELDPRRL